MPSSYTYPGVYVEEIPSGVRTIVGVPTSVTAFMGRASRGPTTGPGVSVFSFDEFERNFGGLDLKYPMTFAVRDYFQNGGSQAVIVRLTGGNPVASSSATLPGVAASSVGKWGDALWIGEIKDVTTTPGLQARYQVENGTNIYDLTVWERVKLYTRQVPDPKDKTKTVPLDIYQPVRSETIRSVVFKNDSVSSRRADRVFPRESQLLTVPDLATLADPKKPLAKANPKTGLPDPPMVGDPVVPGDTDVADRKFLNGDPGNAQLTAADYKFHDRLDRVAIFNLMCLPPDSIDGDVATGVLLPAVDYCVERRAMLVVDPPAAWTQASDAQQNLTDLGITGPEARNAVLYFPRVKQVNPLRDNAIETFVPCGIMAGRMAQTDVTRGVWKAAAGIDAAVGGISALAIELTDGENGLLNPLGINCLRTFPIYGPVIWGARTLRGAEELADDYKYAPVRRLALYIEESLFRGTKWVVFEPNGENPLWAQIRANVGAFMQVLFLQGAFAGTSPAESYFINCDKTTNPEILVNQGVVTIRVGFAPLRPAEFVVIQLTQIVKTSG